MSETNPYADPTTHITVAEDGHPELASRGVRLGAAIIDALLLMVIIVPLQWVGGYLQAATAAAQSGRSVGFGLMLLWGLIGLVIFVAVQGLPLHQTGQTWAKRWLNIRIVDLEGNKPPLLRLLALRYLPIQIAVMIPVVGVIIALVNPLFIFRQDRRCLHDLIAGTRVIVAR